MLEQEPLRLCCDHALPAEQEVARSIDTFNLGVRERTFATRIRDVIFVRYLDTARGIDPDVEEQVAVGDLALAKVDILNDIEAVGHEPPLRVEHATHDVGPPLPEEAVGIGAAREREGVRSQATGERVQRYDKVSAAQDQAQAVALHAPVQMSFDFGNPH